MDYEDHNGIVHKWINIREDIMRNSFQFLEEELPTRFAKLKRDSTIRLRKKVA